MSTTSDKKEKVEWEKLGQEGKKPPEITELVELLIKFNDQSKDILQDTRTWLKQQKEQQ
tara:strand:- start:416 stop:592 length:177 start_codon:yes stop_codon:yes gene_type:complete